MRRPNVTPTSKRKDYSRVHYVSVDRVSGGEPRRVVPRDTRKGSDVNRNTGGQEVVLRSEETVDEPKRKIGGIRVED